MGLQELALKRSYRTGRDDLLREFYIPALAESVRYDRAVGFFSSSILSLAAQGLTAFFGPNHGAMRLVFGGELSSEDFDAATRGERLKELDESLAHMFEAALERMVSELDVRRLDVLAFLVATGRLEMRFALRRQGMFHDKFGLLFDRDGKAIGFDGSANESASAFMLNGNWERIRTYWSWESAGSAVVAELQSDFEALWAGTSPDCLTLPLSQVSKDRLIAHARDDGRAIPSSPAEELLLAAGEGVDIGVTRRSGPAIPDVLEGHPFEVRPHQRQALQSWQRHSYRGIAELCTGAGKTILAAYGIVKIWEARQALVVVITVPYIALAEQWCDVLQSFGIVPVRCWSGHAWLDELGTSVTSFRAGGRSFLCAVIVNATFADSALQEVLAKIPRNDFLFIGDECHHHRSPTLAPALPENALMRLGLSATPYHYVDDVGNARLNAYYGPTVSSYSLADALRDGVLTPYEYYPHLVVLTDNELLRYRELSGKIAQLYAAGANEDTDSPLQHLLRQRAALVALAANKDVALARILDSVPPQPLTLVYCGIDATDGADSRQIDRVTAMLTERRWTVAHYTARESPTDRRRILSGFRSGFIDALVAMRCLDEGVDVPGCTLAFILASSSDPRQFIQRRGRVLRRAPGKKLARIHDFIVTPGEQPGWDEIDRRLVGKELRRVKDFADTAVNRIDVLAKILDIAKTYDLVHHL